MIFFFFNDTATTEIYTYLHTLSLHDALPISNLVKGRVLGPDPSGDKKARAERMGQHMTWQLLYRMPGWEEETDRMLLMLPIVGCVFRKTRSEEHTSELQSLMRISYAVFCLKKKKQNKHTTVQDRHTDT